MIGRRIYAVSLLATVTFLAVAGYAQPPSGGMGGMMNGSGSSGMGMMGGSMMNMMMGQGSGMGNCTSGGSMMGNTMMGRSGIEMALDARMDLGRILQLPDLSGEQREALTDRSRELQRQLLQLDGKALEARFGLQDTLSTESPDPQAVGRALRTVFGIRAQMVEAALAAGNDARNLLSEEQRAVLSSPPGMGMGMGGMQGGMMRQQ